MTLTVSNTCITAISYGAHTVHSRPIIKPNAAANTITRKLVRTANKYSVAFGVDRAVGFCSRRQVVAIEDWLAIFPIAP